MKVGDVVLTKTDGDTSLRWVGVVKEVNEDFVKYVSVCVNLRKGADFLNSADTDNTRKADDLMVIGHVDDALISDLAVPA